MNLKQDQRAMLQLLLERGQSYEDLSGLLGVEVSEVRSRARAALTELGGADPDAAVGLTDYLLGQADPIGRADAVRHLGRDPEAMALAREIVTKLEVIAPAAELPDLARGPAQRPSRRRAVVPAPTPPVELGTEAPQESRASRTGGGATLSTQGRMLAVGGSLALIVIVGILALAGVFSGGGDNASGSGPSIDSTEVVLRPAGGSGVAGEATFDQTDDDFPYMDLRVNGLSKLPKDEGYFVWFMFVDGDQEFGLPVRELDTVDADGNFTDRLALFDDLIPVAVLSTHIDISRSNRDQLQQTIASVVDANPQIPVIPYTGESIARGRIPRLDAEAASELGLTPEDLGAGAGSGGGNRGGAQE